MLKMIQSTKFKHINSSFLNKLKDDAIKIKNETKLLIAADQTTNFYKLQAVAKRVETLTVDNRTMRVIQVSASPTPLPRKQSCFHFHLALRLKGMNIEKGEGGGRGVQPFLMN